MSLDQERKIRVAAVIILAVGAALQFFLWSRHWVAPDQLTLLALGYDWVQGGPLQPFAKFMSGGGRIPGSLLQLLIGGSLEIWPDYRSPTLLMSLTHLAAVSILGLTLRSAIGDRSTVFFLAVYWLSPWRLFHSAFLWEPGFVFLPAAIHMACAYRLRQEPRFWPSATLAATIILTMQVHASFLVLVVATAILMGMRKLRLNLLGASVGFAAGCLTLIPTALALLRGDLARLAPNWGGDLPPVVGNAFKGLLYWFRLGSLDAGRRLHAAIPYAETSLDGSTLLPLVKFLLMGLIGIAVLSILVAILASWEYFRRNAVNRSADGDDPEWVRHYALAFLLTIVLASAISPVTIQSWHVIITLHAACIPVALWLERHLLGDKTWSRSIAAAFVPLLVIAALVGTLSSFMYQRPSDIRVMEEQVPRELAPLFPSISEGIERR
jgi:hypothetical protein